MRAIGGEVAAVDAHAADRDAVGFEARRQLHHFARALLGVVGVDQQDDALGPRAREILERGHLVVVHLHERVRHGADDRHAVAFAGEHIGGAGKAGDVAGARRIQSGLGAMRGAQAEIGQDFSRRRQHHARGFRRDQRLEVQNVDEARFHQLRLRQRRGDADQRLVGKAHGAFRDRVHVAGETEGGKIVEQIVAKAPGAFEPIDLGGGEPQRFEIVERVVEAGGEQKAAPRRQPPHEKLEYRLLVLATIQIGLDHVEFVEIGEQGAGRGHLGRGGLEFVGLFEPRWPTIRRNCLTGNTQNDMVSTLNQHYAPAMQERTISLAAGWRLCGFILLLFVAAATLSAARKDVTRGFDEVAHVSYIAHIQRSGKVWPAFEEMRMLDPSNFQFTGAPNYLNHPSPYYALLALIGPKLEGHPQAIIIYRLLNVALAGIGLAALLAIGLAGGFSRITLYAYVVPLACIPVLVSLAGSVNNDNAAFAGGAIAMLAAWKLLATGGRAWLLAMLGGVVIASWAKLTGLLLIGGMAGGVLAWLLWRGRIRLHLLVPIAIAALIATAPYIALTAQYGNPTPDTAGQIAMLREGAHAAGWDAAARMPPISYVVFFVLTFIAEWMPSLMPRNALNYAALLIPVGAAVCACGGIAMSARRLVRRGEDPLDVVVVASVMAFIVTFVAHGVFSYQRHVEYGWLMDAYPRYYLPLAALIPLAGSVFTGCHPATARAQLAGRLPHRRSDRFPVIGYAARIAIRPAQNGSLGWDRTSDISINSRTLYR